MVVLRPNAPPVSPALAAVIRAVAERDGIALDRAQLAQRAAPRAAADAASEWNTLLIQARADRGPQWDVLGQRYMVDEHSDLFFDPSPLAPPQPPPEPEPEQRPMPNGIVHDNPMQPTASPINHHLTGAHYTPSMDGSPMGRYDTPRRSLRDRGPNGRDA